MAAETHTVAVPPEHREAFRAGVLLMIRLEGDSVKMEAESAAENSGSDTADLESSLRSLSEYRAVYDQIENDQIETIGGIEICATAETLMGAFEETVRWAGAKIKKECGFSPVDLDAVRPTTEALGWATEEGAFFTAAWRSEKGVAA